MLRKDDILLTQPTLWSKAKIYGQSIKYNQLMTENLESSTTTVPITNVVGTYVQVLEPSLVGHKVYVKIDYDNEIRLGLCFFKAYQSSKGVPLGYNLVNGQALIEITAPTTETEGVYTITSDMVHSGTNYLQVYYFVYANCPIGQKRMAVQFVDLTALGLDTIVNSVADFHNTPLGKVMQNDYWFQKTSGEIISAESPLKFYKGNTLLRTYTPTANPIVLRSVGILADTLTHHNGKLNRVFAEVDLGTLNWTYQSAQARFIATNIATLIKKPLATTEKANMLCAKYTTSDWSSAGGKDKVIYLNTNGNLGIRDNAYTDATTFKTAMSGVKLIYELATPTTENVGTLMIPNDFEKIVADNGVELGFDK